MAALALIGPQGARQLGLYLADETNPYHFRYYAANFLATTGTNAEAVVPLLVERIQDKNYTVAREATKALGALKQKPDLVVPALAQAIQLRNDEIGREAAQALAAYGREAREAVPMLLKYLENPVIGNEVKRAVLAIAPEALDQ